MPFAPPTIAIRLRVPLCASAAIIGMRDAHPRVIDERGGSVIELRVRPEPNVYDNDASTSLPPDECTALHRAERDRQIGCNDQVTFAGGRVEPTRHIERDDSRTRVPQRLDATNCIRNHASRLHLSHRFRAHRRRRSLRRRWARRRRSAVVQAHAPRARRRFSLPPPPRREPQCQQPPARRQRPTRRRRCCRDQRRSRHHARDDRRTIARSPPPPPRRRAASARAMERRRRLRRDHARRIARR